MSLATFDLAFNYLRDEPRAAARLLELETPEQVAPFLEQAPLANAVQVLLAMQPRNAGPVLAALEDSACADMASAFNVHQLTACLRILDGLGQEKILKGQSRHRQQRCRTLLQFGEDTVGSLVDVRVPVFSDDLSMAECLQRIRKQGWREGSDAYVTDDQRCLLGRLSLADLLSENPERPIATLPLNPVVQVSGRVALNQAAQHPGWKQGDILAVTDARRAFVGVLRHRDLREALSGDKDMPHTGLAISEVGEAFSTTLLGMLDVFSLRGHEHAVQQKNGGE